MTGGVNILFVLRADAAFKGGGDLVQADFYRKILEEKIGCKIFYSHALSDSQVKSIVWDVVQVFNISRLQENSCYLKGVKFKKIVLCPILQPGFSFTKILAIKNYIRAFLSHSKSLLSLSYSPMEDLKKFDGFVFLSVTERVEFYKLFPGLVSIRSALFHNGVSDNVPLGTDGRVFDFIVVGRVEPKKRVVELIESVNKVRPDALLLCVGGVNWYHPVYALKFFVRMLKGQVVYLGKRNPEIVYGLMRQTKTLLNFSELEVSPLVDLEALASGCKVISTIYSYTHLEANEWFSRIDVKDSSQREFSVSVVSNQEGKTSPKVPTWSENSHDYIAFIKDFLKLRAANDA